MALSPDINSREHEKFEDFNGKPATRSLNGEIPVAQKITTVGTITYIAIARPGTSQSSLYWQVKRIDTTTDVVITWADGDANFDNVATDLTALIYS